MDPLTWYTMLQLPNGFVLRSDLDYHDLEPGHDLGAAPPTAECSEVQTSLSMSLMLVFDGLWLFTVFIW